MPKIINEALRELVWDMADSKIAITMEEGVISSKLKAIISDKQTVTNDLKLACYYLGLVELDFAQLIDHSITPLGSVTAYSPDNDEMRDISCRMFYQRLGNTAMYESSLYWLRIMLAKDSKHTPLRPGDYWLEDNEKSCCVPVIASRFKHQIYYELCASNQEYLLARNIDTLSNLALDLLEHAKWNMSVQPYLPVKIIELLLSYVPLSTLMHSQLGGEEGDREAMLELVGLLQESGLLTARKIEEKINTSNREEQICWQFLGANGMKEHDLYYDRLIRSLMSVGVGLPEKKMVGPQANAVSFMGHFSAKSKFLDILRAVADANYQLAFDRVSALSDAQRCDCVQGLSLYPLHNYGHFMPLYLLFNGSVKSSLELDIICQQKNVLARFYGLIFRLHLLCGENNSNPDQVCKRNISTLWRNLFRPMLSYLKYFCDINTSLDINDPKVMRAVVGQMRHIKNHAFEGRGLFGRTGLYAHNFFHEEDLAYSFVKSCKEFLHDFGDAELSPEAFKLSFDFVRDKGAWDVVMKSCEKIDEVFDCSQQAGIRHSI